MFEIYIALKLKMCYNCGMTIRECVLAIGMAAAGHVLFIDAAPVTPTQAAQAATRLASLRGLHKEPGPSTATSPLQVGGTTVAHVVTFETGGYMVMRADDDAPPVKLYSAVGALSNLPPAFLAVLEAELSGELAYLAARRPALRTATSRFAAQWQALLEDAPVTTTLAEPTGATVGPLLTLSWNQNWPYNYYAPLASGGPGGRAYAGCVAAAMSMILRHHQWPAAVTTNYTYYDGGGSCVGWRSVSNATLNAYQWANMPTAINSSSPTAQKQAIGQLMYHCAVTVDMDFEADGSGAYSMDVPPALQTYFACATSPVRYRSSYNNTQWYALLETNMLLQRPVYYSFYSTDGGHAVVCDGTRNGNEIHLNYGWGGYATAWYNLDNVNGGGSVWTSHAAVMDIAPKLAAVTVHEVAVESDDDHDAFIAPGETAGLRIWLRNTGGASAGLVTGTLTSLDANLSVVTGGPQPYGALPATALASNAALFNVMVSGACPAGDYPLQFVAAARDAWTNVFTLRVDRLPRIQCGVTAVVLLVELGTTDYCAVSVTNTGIEPLTLYLTDNLLSGSTNYAVRTSDQTNGPLFVWQDLTQRGIPVQFSDDDGVSQMLNLGFDFPFFGQSYSQIMIGANGGIGLTNGILYYQNRPLPTTKMFAPARFLAPLWCDLEPSKGGVVRYHTAAGQFTVSWDGVPLYGTTTTETFQVILRPNGEILYQYKQYSGIPTNTIGVQAGVSPAGPALQVACNQPFVHDGLAVQIAPTRTDSWLSYAPGNASIAPGNATNIEIRASAATLSNGVYTARTMIIHNDPRLAPLTIAVQLVVPEPAVWLLLLLPCAFLCRGAKGDHSAGSARSSHQTVGMPPPPGALRG
jgi:hypothetical protein